MAPAALITFIISLLLLLQLTTCRRNLTSCIRRCGGRDVPYPFGFSDGCEIRLSCDSVTGKSTLGGAGAGGRSGLRVRNITADGLLVDLPLDCHRPGDLAAELFGPNFAPTRRNELLLGNCSSLGSSCVAEEALLEEQLGPPACRRNMSCYRRSGGGAGEVMDRAEVDALGCGRLYSSVVMTQKVGTAVSLEFAAVELVWWVAGDCRCSRRANCTKAPGPAVGFRCRCEEGYEGDGFSDGIGCRKAVSDRCNPSNYLSGKCGGTARVGILVGGIVAGAALMAVLAIGCYFIRRRSSSMRSKRSTKRLLSEAAGTLTVPLFPYKEIERATNSFSDKQRLGTGAYGTVYAGKLRSGEWVAVKKIKHHGAADDSVHQVVNEIKLISSVSHPNLVRLLGCCIEGDEQILVYEFMPNGTLAQHLQRERGHGLPWTVRLTIAADTAKAIAYLHSSVHPPIFHRDIKSSNILLDSNFKSKVADFGLSRFGMISESSHISTAPQGTPGYLDPQYHQNFHLSDKSDVYSFGVVLVEIISAMKVVDFNRTQSEVNLAALAIDRIGKGCVDEIIDPLMDPHRDAWTLSSIHKVAELAFRCLAFHRDMRPSMIEVAAELEHIRQTGWPQMDDYLSSSSSLSSSGSEGSESSLRTIKKTVEVDNNMRKKLVIPQGTSHDHFMMAVEDESPVSLEDAWQSENSTPSTNSLLANPVR